MDRWGDARSPSHGREQGQYNTVEGHKEYEDPDYFYGTNRASSANRIVSSAGTASVRQPQSVMSLPRSPPHPTHIAIHNTKQSRSPRWRMVLLSLLLAVIGLVLVVSIVALLVLTGREANFSQGQGQAGYYVNSPSTAITSAPEQKRVELEISANHLLTLLITKRKVCLFEASTDDEFSSKAAFLDDHLETARLLFHSNLSHAGVPVHPLQFQRYARTLGVDPDCHVVIYDRGQIIWSTYAAWIFKLFGHERVSVLAGGYLAWKTQQGRSGQYRTERGVAASPNRAGSFLAAWNSTHVITYDDVLVNAEVHTHDVVDAQTKEEYDGIAKGALFGHIRGAVNIPIDAVFDWASGRWVPPSETMGIFANAGLSQQRPVIVYCSTSVRASMVWWSLTRLSFRARVYFGGWPEWVVRAPDSLKVLGSP